MRSSNKNNGSATFSDNSGTLKMQQRENFINTRPYQTNDQEDSIAEQIQRIVDGIRRLTIAAKYQFHRRTFGFFKPIRASWIKTGIIASAVYILFFRGEGEVLTFNSPVSWAASAESGLGNELNLAASVAMSSNSENPFAPAAPSDLRGQQVKHYIKRFSSVAVAEMDKFGIPASILMAQGIIESRCGSSTLASKVNNHFGIKCFSKKCAKGHCTNFEDDFHKDFFRSYTSAWESWRDHSILLSSGRYKPLLNQGKNFEAWAIGLKKLGYATDANYDDKLIEIIKKYQLNQLDDL